MRSARISRELDMLSKDPPCGVAVWPAESSSGGHQLDKLIAKVQGPKDTPYEDGCFEIQVGIPKRYPFEPPVMRFVSKVYHPNVDQQGRICLDSLKMPPHGAWQPSLNVSQILSQIRILLAEPNPDDPLMPEISKQFQTDRKRFEAVARQQTKMYAKATGPAERKESATSRQKENELSNEKVPNEKVHEKKRLAQRDTNVPNDSVMKKQRIHVIDLEN